jgi:hypothetical protein
MLGSRYRHQRRKLYGHCDHVRALDRVTAAYGRTASHTQMRLLDGGC